MHLHNGDQSYQSPAHAISYWPEKETAVGVRLNAGNTIEVAAPFEVKALFNGCVTYNPKKS
jgi:hypothetical protein